MSLLSVPNIRTTLIQPFTARVGWDKRGLRKLVLDFKVQPIEPDYIESRFPGPAPAHHRMVKVSPSIKSIAFITLVRFDLCFCLLTEQ